MDVVRAILTPMASLKLTVVLLILGVVVTFIATLDQTRADVYAVKMKHFKSVMVEVPFETFFVPAWFPERQNIPGSIYIPSGLTLLVLMLLNVTAAHLLRFRLQAKGGQLVLGVLIGLVAGLVTWAVIFNGQSSTGFQAEPPISWTTMWMIMQVGMLGIGLAAGIGCVTLDRSRLTEKILLGIGALLSIGVLVVTLVLGEEAFIGQSAMRILWQLIQSTMAALVAYVACVLLFRRKAGIVLLHLGIAGLMLNEIFVTVTNDEQRMNIMEGQTVSEALDIRAVELAIIDVSDPEFDQIVAVPSQKLVVGETLSDDQLPFDIVTQEFFMNSNLARINPSEDNLADTGIGLNMRAVTVAPAAGTASNQSVDFASAYVKLEDKQNGKSLGTHLVTMNVEAHNADQVTVDGKTYRVALRFKTEYKPYALTLIDAKQEFYVGTKTPRWYSSDVVLDDFENNIKTDQKIWMNNPLRYSDETFYQSGMNVLGSGQEMSTFQIVRNKGWMIPYVCCMFTVVGLMAQFGVTLLGFLEKSRGRELRDSIKKTPPQLASGSLGSQQAGEKVHLAELATSPGSKPELSGFRGWTPSLFLVLILLFAAVSQYNKNQVAPTEQGINLELLGKLPITINGRVQPLDSFARNTARELSKSENIRDGADKQQSALRWFADTLFEADGFEEYRVFRIEDQTVLGAMELPATFPAPRKNFRYTLSELLAAETEIRKQIPDPSVVDPDNWTTFQKRLSIQAQQMQKVYGMKLAFGAPGQTDDPLLKKLDNASSSIISSPLIPLVVPTEDADTPWISFSQFKGQLWLNELAKEFNVTTTQELGREIVKRDVVPILREDQIRSRIISAYLSDPEFLKVMEAQHGESNPSALARILENNWDAFPAALKSKMETQLTPLVDAIIAQEMPRLESVVGKQILAINGGQAGELKQSGNPLAKTLLDLQPAYLEGDAEKFNSTLETYLDSVEETPPTGMSPLKISTELRYNQMSAFITAAICYLTGSIVAIFSWIGWRKTWIRASTSLLVLGLLIHIIGLVDRIIISGRPPVTNLYSSAIFVSAVMVILMMIVERITKLGIANFMAGLGAFLALLWAWSMTIVDGDTFTVMVAVLDTQFWLATHVVCISIGYSATFGAGLLGLAYLIGLLITPAFATKESRRQFSNVIYGVVCFGLLCSFFGTVLGGLWGDDSWGRFWGWDPKENGALMIVLWNAVVLHARWGGIVKDRGLAALAILGNVVVLWSWKGVNALGVGLHAYAGTEDTTLMAMLLIGAAHVGIACLVVIPMRFWMSFAKDPTNRLQN